MSFKQFLQEATLTQSTIEKAILIIQRKLSKILKTTLYRYGGENGTELLTGPDGKKYVSYLYFFNNNHAFRINTNKYEIVSIDIWKTYTIETKPQFTMHVKDLTYKQLLYVLYDVAAQIKNPHVEEIPLYFLPEENENLSESYLTEARRSTPSEFFHFAKEKFGEHANFARMSWQDIANVAAESDVQVPGFVRGQKNNDDPRGVNTFSIIPPGENPETEQIESPKEYAAAEKKKPEPILYIKVTAQDPETKKFLSTADSKQAQNLLGQIQKSLDSGIIPKEELKEPNTLYGHLTQLVELVCRGKLKSLLIFGGPGTGKTFSIMKTINDAGLRSNVDFVKMSGKATALGLYQTLYSYRENGLVVFDDIDSIWNDDGAVNLLKAGLDSYDKREISWSSNRTLNISKRPEIAQKEYMEILDKQLAGEIVMNPDDLDKEGNEKPYDQFKFPETFEFKGKIIFISNMKEKDFDTAVLSRSAKINMDITPAQLLERMRTILPVLGGTDTPLEVKEEVLDFLSERITKRTLNVLTMREFVKTLAIANSGAPNWKALSAYA